MTTGNIEFVYFEQDFFQTDFKIASRLLNKEKCENFGRLLQKGVWKISVLA